MDRIVEENQSVYAVVKREVTQSKLESLAEYTSDVAKVGRKDNAAIIGRKSSVRYLISLERGGGLVGMTRFCAPYTAHFGPHLLS